MREWFAPAEIVAARSPELPSTVQALNRVAAAWRADPTRARKADKAGGGWEYHLSALPPATQARLQLMQPLETSGRDEASKALWARFERLSAAQKQECQRRLSVLDRVDAVCAAGLGLTAAVALAASEAAVSAATVFNWLSLTHGMPRGDRLAALAPRYKPTAARADCHPSAWEALTSDYLRPEKPTFSACYRRVRKAASAQGWLPLPSERALRRRFDAEVPAGVVTLAREGRDKAKSLYPAQKRTRTHFHAMQAVNADGHKLDVFVKLEDGRVTRVHLIAMQDLLSGMVVAWRLSETECKEAVRLVIGDMVEAYGIPDKCWLDNGRAFASKWITGRMANRFRFTIRDEDPQGILTALGVEVHWTTPYHGQAKPIERAFRDLADAIAKHPFCAGAYTGNRPDAKPENYASRAIPIDAFRAHVAAEIAEHNGRSGRRAEACRGRSFRETFEQSLAEPTTIVRWPTREQRALWLLAAESLTTSRGSGEIVFHGNRYWSAELNGHAGEKLVARFDPDRLHESILVYTLDDRLIAEARCIATTGFDDVDAARVHARDRAALLKATAEQLRLHRKMSADALARLYAPAPATPAAPSPPAVKRLAVGGGRAIPEPETLSDEEMEAAFARGLRLVKDEDG